jgi:hypothetical protein
MRTSERHGVLKQGQGPLSGYPYRTIGVSPSTAEAPRQQRRRREITEALVISLRRLCCLDASAVSGFA